MKILEYTNDANQSGGAINKQINFPFEYMKPDLSHMDVKWVLGDKDKGEKLPMKNLTKIYKDISDINFGCRI